MSDFKTATPPAKAPDLKKRVNYTLGMVLGVDEFQQEQAYFLGKHQWHQRALHGYGTVHGLQISKALADANGPEIYITAGRAVDPLGRDICVTPAQCARLNDWLRTNRQQLNLSESASFEQTLYVILCYRECATDVIPIPGEPCRSQQDAMAASRLKDEFELKFALDRPLQVEEETIREFGALLGRIDISGEAPAYLSREELLERIRQLGAAPASPPLSSPPGTGEILYLDPATACEDLRAALRVWVTEVRPKLLPEKNKAAEANEHCVLLARLDFHVDPGLAVDFDSIEINEDERPYLLSTRLLQEWLLCGRATPMSLGSLADVNVASATDGMVLTRQGNEWIPLVPGAIGALALDNLTDVNAPAPADGEVLTRQGSNWVAAPLPSALSDHGALTGLGDDDHPQYLLSNGTRALTGNLGAGNNRIINLAPATANGDAVPFQQAVKTADPAGGDLSATFPNPRVAGLQGRPVAGIAPNANDVLIWDGTQWIPSSGSFVRAAAGPYAIVAAGFFQIDGSRVEPAYNNLNATPLAGNRFRLNFTGYSIPNPATHNYIVKGIVWVDGAASAHTIEFFRFQNNGIVIQIFNPALVPATGFMVEISEIRIAV